MFLVICVKIKIAYFGTIGTIYYIINVSIVGNFLGNIIIIHIVVVILCISIICVKYYILIIFAV